MATGRRATAVYNDGQVATNSGGTFSIPTSGNGGTVAVGDIGILKVGSANDTVTLTTPTGWTLVSGPDTASTLARGWLFVKTFASGDIGGSIALTFSTAIRWNAQLTIVSGGTVTGMLSGAVVETASNTSAAIPTISSVPAGAFFDVAFVRRFGGSGAPDVTLVSGYQQGSAARAATNFANTPELSTEDMYKLVGSAGTYGGETATVNKNSVGVDYAVAIPAVAGGTNTAPTASAGADLTSVEPYSTVTLVGTDTDAEGNVTTRAWTQVTGPAATITDSGTGTATVKLAGSIAARTDTFRYTVTDAGGLSSTDDMTIAVLPVTERAAIGGVVVPMEIRAAQ